MPKQRIRAKGYMLPKEATSELAAAVGRVGLYLNKSAVRKKNKKEKKMTSS